MNTYKYILCFIACLEIIIDVFSFPFEFRFGT